jgi:dienelactone hydrolase
MKASLYAALVAFTVAIPAYAADLAGRWEGAAVKGDASSPVAIEFQKVDGEWAGGVSFPRSGSLDYPIDSVTQQRNDVRFTYKSRGVMRAFQGEIDGDRLTGRFTMNGEKFDTELERTPAERPYSEEDIVYYNDDVKIAATLFVPKGEGRHPALVMLHGSGNNERYRYRFLADFYARLGIACLFGDKRGCGESGGDWREVGFEPLAWDGIKGLEFLQQRDDIDPDRIGMTGISQAGWIMTLAASLCDDVKFLVVNSGANVSVEEEGYFDYVVALRDKGWGEDVQQTARAVLEQDNHVTRTGEGYDELREMIAAIKDEPWRKDFDYFALPLKMRENSFYKKILDFDPRPYLEQNDIPVLWNYGAEDKSVKPEDSIAILEEVDQEFGKDYTINVYPGADHGLFVAPDLNVDALPLRVYAPGYLDDVEAWLRARVLRTE